MAHDPLDIHAQELSREEAQQRAQLAAQTEAEDIKWLMSSKRGRRIARRILDRAGVWQLSFNTNALTMAFGEKHHNENLALLAKIHEHCPQRYTEMVGGRGGRGGGAGRRGGRRGRRGAA